MSHSKSTTDIIESAAKTVAIPFIGGGGTGVVIAFISGCLIAGTASLICKPFDACNLELPSKIVVGTGAAVVVANGAAWTVGLGAAVGIVALPVTVPYAVIKSFWSIAAAHKARKKRKKRLKAAKAKADANATANKKAQQMTAAKLLGEKRSSEVELADEVSRQIALPPKFAIVLEQQEEHSDASETEQSHCKELQLSALGYRPNGKVEYIDSSHQLRPLICVVQDGNKQVLSFDTATLHEKYVKIVVLVEVPENLECSSSIGVTPVSKIEQTNTEEKSETNNKEETVDDNKEGQIADANALLENDEFQDAHKEATEFFKNAADDDTFIVKYSTNSMRHCRLYAMCRIDCTKHVEDDKELLQWEYCPLRAAFKSELVYTDSTMMKACALKLMNMPLSQELQIFDDFSA